MRRIRTCLTVAIVGTALASLAPHLRAQLSLVIEESGPGIQQGQELWARYRTNDGPRPYVWPLLAPGGVPITRAYPMEKIEGEQHDHPHHRSLWFTHGDVNGIDFWSDGPGRGRIVHRDFIRTEASGDAIVLVSDNDWLGPDGNKVCTDRRRMTFRGTADWRSIEFEVAVTASEGEVRFGDTKEGSFGVRVASNMCQLKGGKIVNSDGHKDVATWGKRAAWVDYHGTVDGQAVGIAIVNHPSSFRYPTYWHVRDYGLFAANPFGWHDFQGDDQVDGSYKLPVGERILLRYRVLLHRGDERAARVAEEFAAYSKLPGEDL